MSHRVLVETEARAVSGAALAPGLVDAAADAAIVRVLQAEQQARAAVAECARAAEREVQQATVAARRIGARAAERVARVQRLLAARSAAQLAQIEAERRGLADHAMDGSALQAALDRAVARLAAELTSDERGRASAEADKQGSESHAAAPTASHRPAAADRSAD